MGEERAPLGVAVGEPDPPPNPPTTFPAASKKGWELEEGVGVWVKVGKGGVGVVAPMGEAVTLVDTEAR